MALQAILVVDFPHLQVTFDLFDALLHLLLALTIFHCSLLSDTVQHV